MKKYLLYALLAIAVASAGLFGNYLWDKRIDNRLTKQIANFGARTENYWDDSDGTSLRPNNSSIVDVSPLTDNSTDLGTTALRWRNVNGVTGTFSNMEVSVLASSSNFSYVPVNTTSKAARVLIQGAGTENPFEIVSSSGSSMLQMNRDGDLIMGVSRYFYTSDKGAYIQFNTSAGIVVAGLGAKLLLAGTSPYIRAYSSGYGTGMRGNFGAVGGIATFASNEDPRIHTSGTSTEFMVQGSFAPTSGTGDFVGADIASTVSTTGSYNGNRTTILRVSPFLKSATSTNTYLMDIGTNTAANGAGLHTSLFVVDKGGQVEVRDGTLASPTYSFISDTNSGLFLTSDGETSLSAGGAGQLTLNSAGLVSSTRLALALGSSSDVALQFAGDIDTGFFSPGANKFAIVVGGDTRLTITSTGYIGIGTISPSTTLHIATSTDWPLFLLDDSDGDCDYNPEAGGVTVSCTSDERLKKDIKDAKSVLTFLDTFRIRDYTMKANGEKKTSPIAQEVQKRHPEMVKVGAGGYLSLEEIPNWKLVKAIQELNRQNIDQQRQIDVLKDKIFKLETGHTPKESMLIYWLLGGAFGLSLLALFRRK